MEAEFADSEEAAIRAEGLMGDPWHAAKQLAYKGIIDIDGNANSWSGYFWKVYSNSVVLKVDSNFEQWHYEYARPWEHYIPVAANMSNLFDQIELVLNPEKIEKMQQVADASTELARITLNWSLAQVENRTRAVLASRPVL